MNKSVLDAEFNKKTAYFGNAIMWTTMFLLPLYILLDYLLLSSGWIDLVFVRLIGFGLSYMVYTLYRKNHWDFEKSLTWFVAINIFIQAIICGLVPSANAFPYFILLGLYLLAICSSIFLNPTKIFTIVGVSFLIIFLLFSFKNIPDKYSLMFANGGGVYIAIALIACFLGYSRYTTICKKLEDDYVNGIFNKSAEETTNVSLDVKENISLPKILPNIELPKVAIPALAAISTIEIPKVEIPTLPTIEIPNIELPKIDIPALSAIPTVEIPTIDIPKVDIPSLAILPNIELPKVDNLVDIPVIDSLVNTENQVIKPFKLQSDLNTAEEVVSNLPDISDTTTNVLETITPKNSILDTIGDNISVPVMATVLPIVSTIIGNNKEEVIDVAAAAEPKLKKSIHEEIEDTIRLLRGEKQASEVTAIQSFVSPNLQTTITQPEEALSVSTPELKVEESINLPYNANNLVEDEAAVVSENITAEVSTPILPSTNNTTDILNNTNLLVDEEVAPKEVLVSKNAERFNLNDLIESNVIDNIDSIHLKDQSVQLNISPTPNFVYLDKNKINLVTNKIIQHIIRYSPSSSIITCNAEQKNNKAVVEITSHSTVNSGELLKAIIEDYKINGTLTSDQSEKVGLGSIKEEIENMGGTFYYNQAVDNSNYLKIELSSTQ